MPFPRSSALRPIVTALAAALLALHAWLALSATIGLGVTADETAHLVGGYSYWRFDDYRLQPENGNLPQRWAALPLLPQSPHLDPAEHADLWRRSQVWLIAQKFLFESGNNTEFLLFCARAAMTLWSVATGLLVFCWSRRLWGDGGALLSLALFAFSPTTLAHGPLVTSDMCAAFWLLAATGAWWRLTERITLGRLALSLASAGLLAVAKFSCVLLLPVAALILVWRVSRNAGLRIGRRRELTGRAATFFALGALAVAHVVFAWGIVWAFFGFRYEAFAPDLPEAGKYFVAWPAVMPADGFWHWFFATTRAYHLFPDAYLQGFAYVLKASQQRGAFAAGHFSSTGWWWFFPYAFLIKSSIAELLAATGVAAIALGRWVQRRGATLATDIERVFPLLALAATVAGISITSQLNIGHRHILPLYPILFILAGALARRAGGSKTWWMAGGFVTLAAIESFAVRPHYLAFFNRLVGGPAAGWRHLVDSSLDWGQNLPRLAAWLRDHRRPGEPVYVSMFGSDDPFYHGIEAQELSPYYSFGRTRRWIELEGGLYCVSATLLQDVYSPLSGAWTAERDVAYRQMLDMMRRELATGARTNKLGEFGEGIEGPLWNLDRARFARLSLYLRHRKPDAVIGYSIFVFRLSEAEVRTVVDGSATDFVRAIEDAAASAQGN